jgi:serine protease Do
MRLQFLFSGLLALTAVSTPALAAPGRVSFLGVGIQEISSERAKQLNLPEEAGVEITYVEMNSPAASAGLKVGDVVFQYNGQHVEGTEQFTRMVLETPEGRDVKLQVFRSGASQILSARIGSKPLPLAAQLSERPGLIFPTEPPRAVAPSVVPFSSLSGQNPALGIQVEAIDGQLADFFGVKAGVLVRFVARGSAADKAGLKAGDVITRVGDDKIATPSDLAIRTRRGQSLSVLLTRDHKEMTVMVQLDDRY